MEESLTCYDKPEIFNVDQGSQFTSERFTGKLKAHGIAISMDGRGRALDERLWRSAKHEDVYLKGYGTVAELPLGLAEYFAFYYGEHPHLSLGTPNAVYADGNGGEASIPDHFGGATTGRRCSAAIEMTDTA